MSRFPTLEQYQRECDQWWFQLRDQLQRRDEELASPFNSKLNDAQATLDALNAQIAALTAQVNALQTNTGADFQLKSQRGAANGYASLNAAAQVPPAQLPFAIQVFPVPDNQDFVIVTGMDWPSVPLVAGLTVLKGIGGLNLFATIAGAVTTDGFTADLSGVVNSADYTLAFVRVFQ